LRCPSCAHENTDAAKFCRECASPLLREAKCTACGSLNAPGSKFCIECAQPLTASTSGAATGRTPTPSPGLPPSGVHVLRHSAAKLRRDAGESIEDVSRFLDHSSLAVTTTYLRRLEGQEDRGWDKVAQAIGLQ
jgi:hypothetical protein